MNHWGRLNIFNNFLYLFRFGRVHFRSSVDGNVHQHKRGDREGNVNREEVSAGNNKTVNNRDKTTGV